MATGEDRARLRAHLNDLGVPRVGIQTAGTVPTVNRDPATVRKSSGSWYVVSLGGNWGRTAYRTAKLAKSAARAESKKNRSRKRHGTATKEKVGIWVRFSSGNYQMQTTNGGVYRIRYRATRPTAERWAIRYTGPRGGVHRLPETKTLTEAKRQAATHSRKR